MFFSVGEFRNRYTSILKPLGLSDYEIRVFLTLIEIGPTNYKILVKESNVPTGKIYQVLSTLESKGFIEVVQGKPKLFRASEPRKAFRRRLRQMEEDYLDLEYRIKEELKNLELEYSQRYESAQGTVTDVTVGSNAFEGVVKEHLQRAQDEVLVSSSELISRLHLEESIKDLQLKGVRINAISLSPPAKYDGIFDRSSDEATGFGVNVRLLEPSSPKYIMVDNKSVSLLLDSYQQETCIQIQSPALCRVLRESFIQKWEKNRTLS
jgi:sugar-specific transcriptional regulator TrmB